MSILSWIVFGFVVGLLARALFPGSQQRGCLATIAIGILGSVLGGAVAHLFRPGPMEPAGWIGSILGAIVVLALVSRSPRI